MADFPINSPVNGNAEAERGLAQTTATATTFQDVDDVPAILTENAEFTGKSQILTEECGKERATESPIDL